MKSLEELATVDIPEKGRHKFVLMELSEGTDRKLVLATHPGAGYHREIVGHYHRKLPQGVRVRSVRGGGRLCIGENYLEAYGYSGDYGMARQNLVTNLLEDYLRTNDLPLSLNVRMGEGY